MKCSDEALRLCCSIDEDSGMMTANLSVIPSGTYDYECTVTDRYIEDTTCSYQCNVRGGTELQVRACKDDCRISAEVISTVKVTIKTLDETVVWNAVTIRLKGLSAYYAKKT